MAYDDIFQPGIYKAWNEAIIKEKKIRLKWQEEYSSNLKESSSKKTSQETLVSDAGPGKNQKHGSRFQMDWPRTGSTGTSTLLRVFESSSKMVHPIPLIKSILYEGISHDGKGKAGYLKRRWKSDPEERYNDLICTNWMYGWNHGKANELSCNDIENCNIRGIAFGL